MTSKHYQKPARGASENCTAGVNPTNVVKFPGRAPKPDGRRLLTINIYAEAPFEVFSQDVFQEMLARMQTGDTLEMVADTSAGQVSASLDCVEGAR